MYAWRGKHAQDGAVAVGGRVGGGAAGGASEQVELQKKKAFTRPKGLCPADFYLLARVEEMAENGERFVFF